MDKKIILHSTLWSAFEKWGDQFINFIIYVVLARSLSPKVFGIVAIGMSVVTIIQTILHHGLNESLIQKKDVHFGHANALFWFVFILSTILSLSIFVSSKYIAHIFGIQDLVIVFRYFSLIIIISSVSTVKISLLKRELRFRELAIRQIIVRVLAGVIALLLIHFNYTLQALVIYYLSMYLLDFIILYSLDGWRPEFSFSKNYLVDLLAFGISNTGLRTISIINKKSIDLIIGYTMGAEMTGLFNIAYNLVLKISNLIDGVISNVIFSLFSKIKDNIDKVNKLYSSAIRNVLMISMPIIVIIIFYNTYIIKYIFGAKWIASSNIFGILSFLIIARSFESINGQLIKSFGYPERLIVLKLFDFLIKVSIIFICSAYGLYEVAMGYVATYIVFLPIYLYMSHKIIKYDFMKLFIRRKIDVLVIFILVLFNTYSEYHTSDISLLIGVILISFIFLFLGYENFNQIKSLNNAIFKK